MYMQISIFGSKTRIEVIVLCLVVGVILAMTTLCSCAGGAKEGFNAGKSILGSTLGYNIGDGVQSSFSKVSPHASYESYFSSLDGNTKGVAPPLPNGEKLIFSDNEFKPECCPATYSNSMGCVCATKPQMQYLDQRGGNRTLSSEF